MNGPKRANLFLIELLFNLFIFALCAAVCAGLLVHARRMSLESTRLTQAVYLAQSTAEALRAGQSAPQVPEDYEITHTLSAGGGLISGEIAVACRGETVYTLSVSWVDDGSYEEVTAP